MASVVGSAGIDDCSAGEGSCAANCGTTCSQNRYQMAWSNFEECSGIDCDPQSSRPRASGGCGSQTIEVNQHSCSVRAIYPDLKDCGPAGGQSSSSGYCVTKSQPIVACVNTPAFTYLCDSCNPMTYGLLGATFSN